MAIPYNVPNGDEEENYPSVDLLLEELLIIVRRVLMQRRREAAANAQNIRHRRYERRTTQPQTQTDVPDDVPNLPDLVLDTSPECSVMRDNRRKQNTENLSSVQQITTAPTTTPQQHDWVQVGAQLRRIADQFRATNNLDQKDEVDGKNTKKDISLLSIFCPPLGGSVWTTVALLIGWGLISRTR